MITYDEEIGSHSSRALIERSAQAARGPDGGGAHSLDEHVRLSDIAPRIALLAGLFLRL